MIQVGITCEETKSGGAYIARTPGMPAAQLSFHRLGTDLVIDNTEIPDEMPFDCIDRALMERAVMDARADAVKIVPVCPVARSMMLRHPQWRDVLKR